MLNQLTNTVDNVCLWDGNLDTWQPPTGYLMLIDDITPAKIWSWNKDQEIWVLVVQNGAGGIGFTWDGTYLTTPESMPPNPKNQPATQGTQNL